MAKKNKYKPKAFESDGRSNDTSANIYDSMLRSSAFRDLSKNQKVLYLYMKNQYYGVRKPGQDHSDIEELQGDDLFYFNMALAVKYGIYSRSNDRQFYRDIAEIEKHGFIKTVSSGKATRSKSIYRFVGDWQQWHDSS